MKFLLQLIMILVIWKIGEYTSSFIPIPGSIIGMFILFALLSCNIIKLQWVDTCASFFLKHLAFFFIPSGVALIASLDLLKANWFNLLLIIFFSTIIVMGITGWMVQKFVKE